MEFTVPRVLIAGTNSGCGKTTVTSAILQALVNRGADVGAFKCGPDYIDPMFHSRITGAKSANLDPFFFDENTLKYLLAKNGAGREISVIEGVMGYYDGLGATDSSSTYAVAKTTRSPVVLAVNAKGAALSALAEIRGFLDFREDSGIRGVIFNRCSAALYPALAEAARREFREVVRPLGYLPPLPDCTLESRHLGLVTAAEAEDLQQKLRILAEQAERSIDLDGLLALARSAPPVDCKPISFPKLEPVRIAVARDRAFCFYYEDSMEALAEIGAELVPFSPLSDAALPPDSDGLYLGGGYPELYAERLSRNEPMLASVRDALTRGLPCVAECGGFMYLANAIGKYPVVGHLPGKCFDTGKLSRFGYVTLTAKSDNLLCKAGGQIPAHEFHYWDCDQPGGAFTAEKPNGRAWDCAVATKTLYAGFPHFHFYANPKVAVNFYNACLEEKRRHA